MKKIFLINIIAVVALLFAACAQTDFDSVDTALKGEKLASTTTIAALEAYMTTESTDAGYFTADRIPSGDTRLIFNGIVTSNDLMGNQYKYIVVQEDNALTDTPRAIRISIDANNVSYFYPTGQRVSVIANNWCIGKYGDTPQMGTYYPRPKDGRLSPGAMPMPIVRQTIISYDFTPSELVPREMTISEILEYKGTSTNKTKHHELDWQLIKIKNVFFNQKGDGTTSGNQPGDRIIFAPSTDGIGYPQAVEIEDENGNKIDICTSEYSKFAQTTIPAESYIGDITCIVSWYQARSSAAGSFQLTLRSLQDLGAGFEGYLESVNSQK
ncbi:MAG: DUF5689 domain-containing protein [Prevotellaceae bacterium]|jgi:hypothetical protein|nr:DUF5689 domain-containing protein [Prevotellaceae bacterium]